MNPISRKIRRATVSASCNSFHSFQRQGTCSSYKLLSFTLLTAFSSTFVLSSPFGSIFVNFGASYASKIEPASSFCLRLSLGGGFCASKESKMDEAISPDWLGVVCLGIGFIGGALNVSKIEDSMLAVAVGGRTGFFGAGTSNESKIDDAIVEFEFAGFLTGGGANESNIDEFIAERSRAGLLPFTAGGALYESNIDEFISEDDAVVFFGFRFGGGASKESNIEDAVCSRL
mmetsp:Transcript_15281/g.23689  ORF Transcript_15281/g.23689 Transcript_15281/m.23689 type:complete len:231 (-) Transcript_15281:258-950(-)